MVDGILHIPLGLGFGAIVAILFWFLPVEIALPASGSLYIFLRELDQQQAKHEDFNFLKGWNFFAWSKDKQLETFLPIAVLMGGGITLYFWSAPL